MFHTRGIARIVATCLILSGCYRGYKSAEELEEDERGPAACAKACQDLGMQMSAFVLVEHQTSGCVCAPPNVQQSPNAAAAAAAGHFVTQQRQEAQQQQVQSTQPPAP